MARKKKPEAHANHERWLVSYSDFMTLLFAFFVVMFAVSHVDSNKVGRFSESFNEALEWQVLHGEGRGVMVSQRSGASAGTSTAQGSAAVKSRDFPAEKESIRRGLAKRASSTPELAGLTVLEVHGELVLRMPERLMFDVGDATLRSEGRVAMDAIADELKGRSIRIRIEGHTDSAPIHTSRFPSNWELSTTRAMAVVAALLDTKKLEPARLAAAGYGEHHPIASNDTPDGRAQNRRVDIIIVSDLPGPAAATSSPPPISLIKETTP